MTKFPRCRILNHNPLFLFKYCVKQWLPCMKLYPVHEASILWVVHKRVSNNWSNVEDKLLEDHNACC